MKMKKSKKNLKQKNTKQIYKECFKFLNESKNYIFITVGLFLFFALYGYFVETPTEVETQILNLIKQVYEKFAGLNVYETIWAIFSNNVIISFLVLILGILLGIFPFLALVSNGFIIGFVARKAVELEGLLILWKLFPHGIFELPAVLISIALGIKMGVELFKKKSFRYNLKNSLQTFFYIVFPLLVIAAIIEGVLVFLIR